MVASSTRISFKPRPWLPRPIDLEHEPRRDHRHRWRPTAPAPGEASWSAERSSPTTVRPVEARTAKYSHAAAAQVQAQPIAGTEQLLDRRRVAFSVRLVPLLVPLGMAVITRRRQRHLERPAAGDTIPTLAPRNCSATPYLPRAEPSQPMPASQEAQRPRRRQPTTRARLARHSGLDDCASPGNPSA